MTLTRDEILAAVAQTKAEVEKIDVPEWNGVVYARRLSAADAEAMGLFTQTDQAASGRLMLTMLVNCLTDENGERLFADDDTAAIAAADFKIVVRLFQAVAKVNGLDAVDVDEATASFAAAQPSASSTS